MLKLITVAVLLILIGCGSTKINLNQFRNQQYGALYTDGEKIQFTFAKAEKSFKLGKARVDNNRLKRAQKEYNFLITHYDHKTSKLRLVEIDDFYLNHRAFYAELIQKSLKKGWIFTSAGYYKKLLKLFPEDPEALSYLNRYKTEIKKRLDYNLSQANLYVKKRKLNKAKRCYNRVLTFNPNSISAKKGLNSISRILKSDKRKRIAKLKSDRLKKKRVSQSSKKKKTEPIIIKKAATPEPEETIEKLSDTQMEKIYSAGIESYENKDFTKAYELFESLKDSLYKDTSLYLERTQDKIDALGLDD